MSRSSVISTTRTTQATETDPNNKVLCKCKPERAAKRLVSSTSANPGRAFYGCAKNRDDPGRCKFFAWEDSLPGKTSQTIGSASQALQPPQSERSSSPVTLSPAPPSRLAHQSRLVRPLPASNPAPTKTSAIINLGPSRINLTSPEPKSKTPQSGPSWNSARERFLAKAKARDEATSAAGARRSPISHGRNDGKEALFAGSDEDTDPEEEEDMDEVFIDAESASNAEADVDSEVEVISVPVGRNSLSTKAARNRSAPCGGPLSDKVRPPPKLASPGRTAAYKTLERSAIPSESESDGGIDWESVDVDSVIASATSTPSTSQVSSRPDYTPSALRIGLGMPAPGSASILTPSGGGSGNLMDMFKAVEEAKSGEKRRRGSEPDAEVQIQGKAKEARLEGERGEWKAATDEQSNPFTSPPPGVRSRPIMPDTPISPQSSLGSLCDIADLLTPVKRQFERQQQIISGRNKQIVNLKARLKKREDEIEELNRELRVERRRLHAVQQEQAGL